MAVALLSLGSTVAVSAQDAGFDIVARPPSGALIAETDEFFSFYPADLCKRTASDDDTFSYACSLDSRTDSFVFRRDEANMQLVLLDLSIADDLDYAQSVDTLRQFFP
jgi:hypothetical protein